VSSQFMPSGNGVPRPALGPGSGIVAVGGIGWGHLLRVHGRRTLGRNESRNAHLLPARDFCKLQVVCHWLARLTAGLNPPPRIVAIGAIGLDPEGRGLLAEMSNAGIDTSHVVVARRRRTTYSVAIQYPDGSGCNLTAANGASAFVSPGIVADAVSAAGRPDQPLLGLCLPEVPMKARAALISGLRSRNAYIAASFTTAELSYQRTRSLLPSIDLLAINAEEAAALVGRPFRADRAETFLDVLASQVAALNPSLELIVTCGSRGAYALADGHWDHCPAPDVACVSSAGAGDALLAAFLAARLVGLPLGSPNASGRPLADRGINSALDFGVLAATDKVRSIDTIPQVVNLARLSDLAHELGIQSTDCLGALRMLRAEARSVINMVMAGAPTRSP